MLKSIRNMKILLFVVLILLSGYYLAYAYDNGDFQIWNQDVLEKKINDDTKIVFEDEIRFGDNANDFYYYHYDIAVVRSLNKAWDVGLSYRHIYEKKNGKFKLENEPNVSAVYKWGICGFSLSNRSRLEYRHFDYQQDNWRYRNMITVKAPWKWTSLQIQPYIANDIFMSSSGASLNNNRFYSGLGLNITKNLKGDIYYLRQDTRKTVTAKTIWQVTNVLGVKFKVAF